MTEEEMIANLGPLSALAGTWEGDRGLDISPSDVRKRMDTPFRERMVFEPIGRVDNHDQVLFGLRYSTTAFRLAGGVPEEEGFHEDLGYWLWDAAAGQVIREFVVPRGIAILAGGDAVATDRSFTLRAELGSETYGIASNRFLDAEFKTVRFEQTVTIEDESNFRYEQNTQMQMKGSKELFDHRDSNHLTRVAGNGRFVTDARLKI